MEEKKNRFTFQNAPQRQSPIAIILILFKFIVIIIKQAWPFLFIFILGKNGRGDLYYTYIFSGLGLVSAIMSIIAYYRFYYYVEGDELIIEKGVLQKTKLNVPFDRIQSINSNQNLIHRFFNVVSLEMDSAGSKGSEIKINALSLKEANELKEYILSKKETGQSQQAEEITFSEEETEEEILNLSIGDLLKIGIGQNHLRSLGVIMAFVFGLGEYADMILEKDDYENMEGNLLNIVKASFFILGVLALILAVVITLVRTVIRFFDLRFYKTKNGFKSISGLFNRNEKFITLKKLQLIKWNFNPISKYFGMFQLYLSQAASAAISRKQTISIPGLYEHHIQAIKTAYFQEGINETFKAYTIHWRIIIRSFSQYGILPFFILVVYQYLSKGEVSSLSFLWPILIFICSYVYWKKWSFKINEEGIETKSGIISTQFTMLKWYKVQSVKIRQSVFQKNRDLTDIHFYTAAGEVKVPYIPIALATQLKDYILFKVETSTKEWM